MVQLPTNRDFNYHSHENLEPLEHATTNRRSGPTIRSGTITNELRTPRRCRHQRHFLPCPGRLRLERILALHPMRVRNAVACGHNVSFRRQVVQRFLRSVKYRLRFNRTGVVDIQDVVHREMKDEFACPPIYCAGPLLISSKFTLLFLLHACMMSCSLHRRSHREP